MEKEPAGSLSWPIWMTQKSKRRSSVEAKDEAKEKAKDRQEKAEVGGRIRLGRTVR